jgi:dsRNA-specific ribonuclease
MSFKDPKTELQELLQSMKLDLPQYIIEESTDGGFNCSVSYDDNNFISSGITKRSAQTSTATKVLEYIRASND